MPERFYHYTSRANAQDIIASGTILPGRGGRIYLTDHRYETGAEAARRLSIIGKVVEVVCVVPPEKVDRAFPEDGRYVERLLMREVVARPGCGTEWYTETPIEVSDCEWLELEAP